MAKSGIPLVIRTGVAFRLSENRAMLETMPLRRRLEVSGIAFMVALTVQMTYRVSNLNAINDLYFPICAAQKLMKGILPYDGTCIIFAGGHLYPPNPLTTILVVLPFAPLDYFGGIVMWSLGVAFLVYGILCTGETWRLLMLLSAPFFVSALTLQWSPFITAIYFLPELLPLSLAKPQIAIPVILSKLNHRRFIGLCAFCLLTLLIDPFWPFKWWPQAQTYDGFIPLLVFPLGLFLLMPLLNWRDRSNQFALFMSAVPQRGFYDALLLWTLPATPLQLLALSACSWIGFLAWSLLFGAVWNSHPFFVVASCYLPAVAMLVYPILSVRRVRRDSARADAPLPPVSR